MSEVDIILSDEFVQYSQLISTIHNNKKNMKEEFKKQYEKFQADQAELDRQALDATKKFEAWKTGAAAPAPDKAAPAKKGKE